MAGTMVSFRNRCSRCHRGSGGRQREGAVAAPAGPCLQYHPKTHHQAGGRSQILTWRGANQVWTLASSSSLITQGCWEDGMR